ncbi:hypothetical protein NDU88_002900 [Pleurodeles waltl]|uniref:Uncharacterized protein n=1 Tax=Pleurodeles waltl TaxID=8319 RepID=A0AAV7W372_PLEWA|nr:hypothetical protein NDU88_002900 [Pleurodeles waltl]
MVFSRQEDSKTTTQKLDSSDEDARNRAQTGDPEAEKGGEILQRREKENTTDQNEDKKKMEGEEEKKTRNKHEKQMDGEERKKKRNVMSGFKLSPGTPPEMP